MDSIVDTVRKIIEHPHQPWAWCRGDGSQARRLREAIDVMESWPREDVGNIYQACTVALEDSAELANHCDDPGEAFVEALGKLVGLHGTLAAEAQVKPDQLREWLISFQFFTRSQRVLIDPLDYRDALGEGGLAGYGRDLAEIERSLESGEIPREMDDPGPVALRDTLRHQQLRMAVWTKNVDVIKDAGDRYVDPVHGRAEAARAFEELGLLEDALWWAKSGAECMHSPWSYDAAARWWRLAERLAPGDVWHARLAMFRSRRNLTNACGLFAVSSPEQWADVRYEVLGELEMVPREAVWFVHEVLRDVQHAWDLAHMTGLDDFDTWNKVAWDYAKIDALATIPIHLQLIEASLQAADVPAYRRAASRLIRLREWATGTPLAEDVSEFVAEMRHRYRRRPRMHQEFDLAGLP